MKKIVRPAGIWSGDGTLNEWFYEHVEPMNKLIEDARVVYGRQKSSSPNLNEGEKWTFKKFQSDTHRAYLIGFQPIKQESAEDILEAFVLDADRVHYTDGSFMSKYVARAKAALDRSKG